MKSNAFTTLLQGALAFSILFSMVLCVRLVIQTRNVRMLNVQVQRIQAANSAVQGLVADCMQYSRRNPAINPILVSIGAKPASSTSTR